MGARRHLRHHPTEAFVQVDLGGDQVGAQRETVLHHGDGGFVAGGLDTQGDHEGRTVSGNSATIEASRRP